MGDPAWWALGVSVAALVVAAMSLAWNVVQFRRSGPKLKIATLWSVEFPTSADGDYSSDFVVKAQNVGRGAVTIEQVFARSSEGPESTNAGLRNEDRFPLRLEAGAEAICLSALRPLLDELKVDVVKIEHIRGVLYLGNGAEILTNPAPLSEPDATIGKAIRTRSTYAERISGIGSGKF